MMYGQDGVYTKTQAYNYVKLLLGVPRESFINAAFFSLFFEEADGGFLIRKPENEVEEIIRKNEIARLNKEYFDAGGKENPGAVEIAKTIMSIVRGEMAAA